MRRRQDGTECDLCGEDLPEINEKSKIQKVLIGRSGAHNVQAILVNGEEIHRCRSLGGDRSDESRDRAADSRRAANRERDAADRGGSDEDVRRESAARHDADAAELEAEARAIDRQDEKA